MALSVALIIGFLAVSVFAILGGSYSKRIEFYFLGVVILLLLGLSLTTQGYERFEGYSVERNESVSGNETFITESSVAQRSSVTNVFTNAFGLLFILIAAGLSLTYFRGRQADREKKRRSVDLDDDF